MSSCLRADLACLSLSLFLFFLPGPSAAGEGLEVLEGFEEYSKAPPTAGAPAQQPSPLRLGGWFKLGTTWNFAHEAPAPGETDWRGLSRLRPELLLETDAHLPGSWRLFASGKGFYDFSYAIHGRGRYTEEVLDEYERELELREAWLAGPLTDRLDLKTGRQIVAWGRSDHLRVTDVLNPLDLREPGLTDIEDLRLPVTMLRLDGQLRTWTVTGLIIPEIRFDKYPILGHDFFPAEHPPPPAEVPADDLNNAGYAAALTGTFPGWDLSFYGADRYHEEAYAVATPAGLRLRHPRTRMAGAAGSLALGNFLLFAEAAHTRGFRCSGASGKFSRSEWLGGIEYAGFRQTLLSVEGSYRRQHGLPEFAPVNKELLQTVVRLSRTFLNERLSLTAVAFTFGARGKNGALQRVQGSYELLDGVKLIAGVVFFRSGDLPAFQGVGDNDRAFAEVKRSF